jgi:flagellar basal body-associated protein FliL
MIILLLLAVLFLAVVVSAMVLVFFRPWLILRGEQDEHQNPESAAPEPREVSETASEDDYRGEGGEG